ncbi:MAG: GvpL/GvpF family gas vesicle protein [Vicinamibacterales bacterium]
MSFPRADADVAPLYVHALTDQAVRPWTEDGRTIESIPIGPVFAVCERRPEAPPLSEDELRRQHAIVIRIATEIPAVLPARFGSLVDTEDLAAIVRRQQTAIDDALALVRGKVQMTLRTVVKSAHSAPASSAATGRQYLELRQREVSPRVPPRLEALLSRVSRYVAQERREKTPAGAVVVYHLVERTDVEAYRTTLDGVSGLTMTGPWPPFAFVPEIWS